MNVYVSLVNKDGKEFNKHSAHLSNSAGVFINESVVNVSGNGVIVKYNVYDENLQLLKSVDLDSDRTIGDTFTYPQFGKGSIMINV